MAETRPERRGTTSALYVIGRHENLRASFTSCFSRGTGTRDTVDLISSTLRLMPSFAVGDAEIAF